MLNLRGWAIRWLGLDAIKLEMRIISDRASRTDDAVKLLAIKMATSQPLERSPATVPGSDVTNTSFDPHMGSL